jgi:hypothetical protein
MSLSIFFIEEKVIEIKSQSCIYKQIRKESLLLQQFYHSECIDIKLAMIARMHSYLFLLIYTII